MCYAQVAHAFSAEIKCRQCSLTDVTRVNVLPSLHKTIQHLILSVCRRLPIHKEAARLGDLFLGNLPLDYPYHVCLVLNPYAASG